ncbi:MAG: hypothetical protein SOY83_02785 [Anaerovoracaceae bacterium]|nr:hypothetical protein [Bacillota bacterium]MDY3954393.1 hypothetical protein [Anaerovoracaceae bacterium]
MTFLKIIFTALLCLPVGYVSILLINKLFDQYQESRTAQKKRQERRRGA